jgi:hypothetical protein
MSAQVRHRSKPIVIVVTNRQHLVEFVVRNRRSVCRASRRDVFDAAHAEVEVAALDGLVDFLKRDLDKFRPSPEAFRDFAGDFDVESAHLRRIAGIGFDERRATFRVSTPSERWRIRDQRQKEKDDRHFNSIIIARHVLG